MQESKLLKVQICTKIATTKTKEINQKIETFLNASIIADVEKIYLLFRPHMQGTPVSYLKEKYLYYFCYALF